MTLENSAPVKKAPTILSFVADLPNLCSLAGLACTVFAIYFSLVGLFYATAIFMVWAVAFDWADGLVARRMKGRTGTDSKFGGQLDLVIDIVSYGVTPAILLMSFSGFNLFVLPLAFFILCAASIRLSYFSTFGLSENKKYTGLALDNNSLILAFVFLFDTMISDQKFSFILYGSAFLLAALNVSQIKTPKLSGNPLNVWLLVFYVLFITGFFSYKLSLSL